MTSDARTVHRSLYDAVETGDANLMRAIWADRDDTTCVHPGALPQRGTAAILRGWTALMAHVDYLQFFLTDVEELPIGEDVVVITCVENILAGESLEAFASGRIATTSVLRREAGSWQYWARHASPIMEVADLGDLDEGDG